MIPLKLQIKNFLSYGSDMQTIDFEPYNLICLSGKNGHGKSALLDAITWAIWGQARKTGGISKPDQGLMRLGQKQMIVIFEFAFNRNKYRIRREFTIAYGKTYAYLDFAMFDEQGNLMSLTDKTIRITQDKIENMIGLGYDSFTNSAFLRQGNSNEFSKKSSKERKEILGTILGLNKYESLRKIALDKVKQFNLQKELSQKITEHIQKELLIFDQTHIDILEINKEFENLKLIEDEYALNKEQIEKEKSDLALKLQECKLLNFKLQQLKEEQAQKEGQCTKIYLQWKDYHKKKIKFANHKDLELKKTNIQQDIEVLKAKFQQKLEYKEQLLKYKEQEQILINNLNEQFNLEMQQKKLDAEKLSINKINIENQIKQNENFENNLNKDLNKIEIEQNKILKSLIAIDETDIDKLEKQFEKKRNFYQKLINDGNLIKTELDSLEQKKKLSFDEQNPSCPLCEQNLSASRKKFIKQQFAKQEKFLNHRIKRITNLLPKLKQILLDQHEEIKFKKNQFEQNKFIQVKNEELDKSKVKIKQQVSEIILTRNELIKLLNYYSNDLQRQDKAVKELYDQESDIFLNNNELKNIRILIHDINTKINSIVYDSDAHKKMLIELEQTESILSSFLNAKEMNLLQEQRKIEISSLCSSLKNMKKLIQEIKCKIIQFDNLDDESVEIKNKELLLNENIKKILNKKENLLHRKGSLENQKSKLEELANEHKKQKQLENQFEISMEQYKTISTALGKDGIQALLIEDAIPEIENEANNLLSKLTDNQAQIFIDSLRDLKKGGVKEALDIKISDGFGIRPYEMFSGGEAFRIDFALRIAISKLLARRAGTSLQTLIIDEGFGSQDEEGLAHIMDCLYKIQDDFAKVIIVSHLPSMKEQFPIHFFVEKSSTGSKINIVEQG